ncbi:unnamed protein product [Microthlaspi erraticum]|uniref:Uncharacterized protein n=1 Tax=Microthlaspi erraticum TaxID=1685480 RepID=A0A6D2I4U8_9BRAS|nr:unnamed protein product [Microthlaspi erraticum]
MEKRSIAVALVDMYGCCGDFSSARTGIIWISMDRRTMGLIGHWIWKLGRCSHEACTERERPCSTTTEVLWMLTSEHGVRKDLRQLFPLSRRCPLPSTKKMW